MTCSSACQQVPSCEAACLQVLEANSPALIRVNAARCGSLRSMAVSALGTGQWTGSAAGLSRAC